MTAALEVLVMRASVKTNCTCLCRSVQTIAQHCFLHALDITQGNPWCLSGTCTKKKCLVSGNDTMHAALLDTC